MKKALLSESQLRRRAEAYENYRAERAMRSLWPWALAVLMIAVFGTFAVIGAFL